MSVKLPGIFQESFQLREIVLEVLNQSLRKDKEEQ